MDDAAEQKTQALNDLRTWRSWTDRRDPLIYAAHISGASLSEIHEASGVAKNTARTAIAAQEEAMTTATDALAKYHHPNFISVEPGRFQGEFRFTWKPFTGREPEPARPDASYEDESLSSEDRDRLNMEYRAAEEMWGIARFHLKARPQVTTMAPLWTTYQTAQTAMTEAFEALLSTTDNTWRAQVMKLTDLHRTALAAAEKWDQAAEELALIHKEYSEAVGPDKDRRVEDLISDYNTPTQGWKVDWYSTYEIPSYPWNQEFQTPTVKTVTEEIEQQKTRIREVADLTGER
ncbi:hypothetical protein [Streptomyces sp. NBC_01304]|uniref:hypothetical protein n=1 Tax=Streptomyces sp. NBC_01304 TaxID=2903818 RepID=UPI002E154BDF|nr:hypothetical protein OG430_49085 [Streptomyces sp. NBC_01304]